MFWVILMLINCALYIIPSYHIQYSLLLRLYYECLPIWPLLYLLHMLSFFLTVIFWFHNSSIYHGWLSLIQLLLISVVLSHADLMWSFHCEGLWIQLVSHTHISVHPLLIWYRIFPHLPSSSFRLFFFHLI